MLIPREFQVIHHYSSQQGTRGVPFTCNPRLRQAIASKMPETPVPQWPVKYHEQEQQYSQPPPKPTPPPAPRPQRRRSRGGNWCRHGIKIQPCPILPGRKRHGRESELAANRRDLIFPWNGGTQKVQFQRSTSLENASRRNIEIQSSSTNPTLTLLPFPKPVPFTGSPTTNFSSCPCRRLSTSLEPSGASRLPETTEGPSWPPSLG